MAVILEARAPPRLRLVGVYREGLVVAPARMGHVIDAAAERAAAPAVENVEGERRVDVDVRMQGVRQLPGLEAHAGDELAGPAGRDQRHAAAIAGDQMAVRVQSVDLDLQPLDRGIDEAHGGALRAILAEHIPGLERVPQLQPHAPIGDRAVGGKTKLALRFEPSRVEAVARAPEVIERLAKILPHEMLQHEAVMQGGTPSRRRAVERLAPEPRHQGPQQQLLGETHAGVGRHLEGAELDQAEPSRRPVGREQLVDADLGAVRVAGHVGQQVAKQAVDQPGRGRRALAGRRHLRQRDLELVEQVLPGLVDARRLAGRPDEQTGKEI